MDTVKPIDTKQWEALRDLVFAEFRKRGANRYADWTVYLKVGSLYLAVTLYLLIFLFPVSPSWYALWAAFGIAVFFLIVNCSHDASHDCLARSKVINRTVLRLNFALLGIDGDLWGLRHRTAHHAHTNVSGQDPDSVPNPFLRLSPFHPYRSWFRFQHLYAVPLYALAFLHTAWVQDFEHIMFRPLPYLEKLKDRTQAAFRMLEVKLFYVTLFLVLPYFLGGFSIPSLLFGMFVQLSSASLVFVLTICLNHYVCETTFYPKDAKVSEQGHFAHQLQASADWSAESPLVCSLMGGANAHTAHHLFPAFSHRHYHWVSKIISDFAHENNLPYHSFTFANGLKSHFRFLKTLGSKSEQAQ